MKYLTLTLTNFYTKQPVLCAVGLIKSINVADDSAGCCIRYQGNGYDIVVESISEVRNALVEHGAEIK